MKGIYQIVKERVQPALFTFIGGLKNSDLPFLRTAPQIKCKRHFIAIFPSKRFA